MLITKRIQIEFTDPTIKAIDYIQDIRKAAENAGLNLFSRYDVQLQYPMPDGDRVFVEKMMIHMCRLLWPKSGLQTLKILMKQ